MHLSNTSFLWDVQPVAPYAPLTCYAAHAALVFNFWMRATVYSITVSEVIRCVPPTARGGDPGRYFETCAPQVGAVAVFEPTRNDIDTLLQHGPVLVGKNNHAMTLKGWNQDHFILVDTNTFTLPLYTTFQYALGLSEPIK
ncbi:hypothetical protein OAU26_03810 [Mariniblastus sp.]|nr:hypothetical protein [Mariniblastus sp.]